MKTQLLTLLLASVASATLQAQPNMAKLQVEFCTHLGNSAEQIAEIRDAKGPKHLTVRLMKSIVKDEKDLSDLYIRIIDKIYADPTIGKIEANIITYTACLAIYRNTQSST